MQKRKLGKKRAGGFGHRPGLHGDELLARSAAAQGGHGQALAPGSGTRRYLLRHRRSLWPFVNEELLGEALSPLRDQVVIATKSASTSSLALM